MNRCTWKGCGEAIEDGIIRNGLPFCCKEHAEEQRRDLADADAQADGFASYEDRAEHFGHTIAESIEPRQY